MNDCLCKRGRPVKAAAPFLQWGEGGCRLLSNFLLPLSPPVNHCYSELLVGINNQKELEHSVIIIIQLIKAYWSGLEAPHSCFTLKAYFLLMWSSTDSMEMWKLGSRILPRMLSSFSSAPIRSMKKKPYVNGLEWDMHSKPWRPTLNWVESGSGLVDVKSMRIYHYYIRLWMDQVVGLLTTNAKYSSLVCFRFGGNWGDAQGQITCQAEGGVTWYGDGLDWGGF